MLLPDRGSPVVWPGAWRTMEAFMQKGAAQFARAALPNACLALGE